MRSAIRNTLVAAVVVTLAANGFAALSQKFTSFGSGPAKWIMAKDEQARWKAIDNDADAQAFIDLFWLRRDPSPGTPANEFRADFEMRVEAADKYFGEKNLAGSLSERGRVLIVLGKPAKRQLAATAAAVPSGPPATGETDAVPSSSRPREVWAYDGSQVKGLKPGMFALQFVDTFNTGEFRLEKGRKSGDYDEMFEKVNTANIVQPSATRAAAPAVAPAPQAAPGLPPLATPAFQAAIAAQKDGTTTIGRNGSVVYAEFVAPTGDFYTPAGIFVPKSANMAADAADTLFGVIEDAAGKVVTSFEEPIKVFNSNGDLLADETFQLKTGKYNVVLGLAKAGQPVVTASKVIDVTEVAKDGTGTSKLILSNNLAETPEAALVMAPFAFGRLKVVPRGNLVFSNKDELSYFVEIHNPSIDPATNLPKLQYKLDLSGGKLKSAISAPLSDAPALPLSGKLGPGEYAIANAIPLGQMTTLLEPGSYNLKLKLIDTISKQSYTIEQSFKIE